MSAADAITGEVLEAEPTLAELEATIQRGLESFLDVGNALLAIKAGKRYREAGFSSFEDYCQGRWEISRAHGYRLVIAAATVEGLARNLSPMGDIRLPSSERQVRPLADLPEDERAEAWTEAVEQAQSEGREPTARDVEDAVERRQPTRSTTTERFTETRQATTETPGQADGEPEGSVSGSPSPSGSHVGRDEPADLPGAHDSDPVDEPVEDAGGLSASASAGANQPDDADAINDAFERHVDPLLTYRVNFDKGLSKALDLIGFDVEKAVACGGESATGHRQTVESIRNWCDRYLEAAAPSHLRRVK